MNNIDLNSLFTLILGGGLVGTITALVNAYRSVKDGARVREKGTIEELAAQRKEAFEEREIQFREKTFAFEQRDYWRNRAADLEFVLRTQGIEIPPSKPEPKREGSS